MTDVVLDPELMESLESGDHAWLEQWLVAEGDLVQPGQLLALARLVQRAIPVTAVHAGVLEDIRVPLGQRFSPGAVLARLIRH
jgi:pyruvate dehydrogenase E2 component (dihydrolipoamide acetyltransferase)